MSAKAIVDLELLQNLAEGFFENAPNRTILEKNALSPEVIGMEIYDTPIFGIAAADDPLFKTLKEPDVIGGHFLTPKEWLPEARSVISFFLPFSRQVRDSNRAPTPIPSKAWLHARIEGQVLLNDFCSFLKKALEEYDSQAIIPSIDPRFYSVTRSNQPSKSQYTSNWSERHVAYVCGLGTFGLSANLITSKGVCGRFGSLITSLDIQPSGRVYSNPFAYCTKCGACMNRCPAQAITFSGKKHEICWSLLEGILRENYPRYGCGKCQLNVPCEDKIPKQFKYQMRDM